MKRCYLDTSLEIIAPSLLRSCLTYQGLSPRLVPCYNQFSHSDERMGNCPAPADGEKLIQHMFAARHLDSSSEFSIAVNEIFNGELYQQTLDNLYPVNTRTKKESLCY